MKIIIVSIISLAFAVTVYADSTYQVENIYKIISVESGTIAISSYGTAMEVSQLLVPTKLDTGTYKITVTRKDSNLYRIDGYDFYIKTMLCLELALRQTAYLEVSGYSIKITFAK